MLNPELPHKCLESTSEPFLNGSTKGKSQPSKPRQGKDAMTLNPIQANMLSQLELPLFMPVLAVEDSPKSCQDKSRSSKKNNRKGKLSVQSEEDSISKEKNLQPYWNELCREMSEKLWSLTKIDLPDLDLIGLSGSAKSWDAQSWFSTRLISVLKPKWLKTSLPSSIASQADCTDCENTKIKSRKIKIYPTPELKKEWNKWMAACRYCFNQAIDYQKKHGRLGKGKLRNIIMQSDLPQWVKDTPCHIRQNAIFDAHQAYRASRDCKFRSCQAPRQTIKFNNCNFSQGKWYPSLTKGLDFISSELIPENSPYATQLIKNKSGDWFCVFVEKATPVSQGENTIIALAPGVRTFLTGFDGQNFLEIGVSDMGRINRLGKYLDDLMSRISLSKSSQERQKMRKAASRLRCKIRDLVDDCHKKTASYLTKKYQTILLPQFETSEMTKRSQRKIRSKTARQMLTWAHYRFKQVLRKKAELSGSHVIDVTEEFTSKTCTKCGHIHTKLGGSKIFRCPVCDHVIPRDWNGALGIMLKALSGTTFTLCNEGDAIVAKCGNIPLSVP
jgi:putative transposase